MCAHGILFEVGRRRRAGLLVDEPDEDVLADVRLQIDDDRPQPCVVGAGDREDDVCLVVGRHELSTRVLVNAPPDTRKLAYGWVTWNGADVSVPFRAPPPVSLLTQ